MASVNGTNDATSVPTVTPTRDATYFLEPIFFLVEDGVFQVPKHHFQHNDVFSTTFMLPPPPGETAEGSSEKKPFELKGILKKDFQAFLRVLYPLGVPNHYDDLTSEEWQSVLRLSSMWEFQNLRDLAVQWLSKPGMLDYISKIQLGQSYDLHDWFVAGCGEIVRRNKGPRGEEMARLGHNMTERLYDLREARLDSFQNRRHDVEYAVRKAFTDVLGEPRVL
ncbi:hypothetical protein NLJ89_g5550 [Agrocybe chaxingu]|uniref:BTB domain-containing protein n=1 Tax=Agrocybe chaxingu TaxID=84603 RepID=A0A9W8MTI1_9AGAR|nr:hypothetical protein NLJ89_g5550 [Agrocybe chaxingu]